MTEESKQSEGGNPIKQLGEMMAPIIAPITKEIEKHRAQNNDDAETQGDDDDTAIPQDDVETEGGSDDELSIHKYSGVYVPKKPGIAQNGSLIVTSPFLYFVGARGTKFTWKWEHLSVEKGKTLVGTIDNAITITNKEEEEENGEPKKYKFTFLPCVRAKAFKRLDKTIQRKAQGADDDDMAEEEEDSALPKVPPDTTLNKMDIVVKKAIKGISVKDFYEVAWSEGQGTDKTPMYGPYLEADGKRDIQIGDWEFAEEGKGFKGPFCGEKYGQKRVITYVYTKRGSEAHGTNTQYCRVEGNDKCVLSSVTQVLGPKYADYMLVHSRFVAARVGKKNLSVTAGLFIEFVTKSILEGKIRAVAMADGSKGQLDLYERIKKACYLLVGEGHADDDDQMEEEDQEDSVQVARAAPVVPCRGFPAFFAGLHALFAQLLADIFGKPRRKKPVRQDPVFSDIQNVSEKLNKIRELASGMNNETLSKKQDAIRSELQGVEASLDKVLGQLR